MPLCQCNTGLFSNVNYENSPWDLKVGSSLVFLHQTLKFTKKIACLCDSHANSGMVMKMKMLDGKELSDPDI